MFNLCVDEDQDAQFIRLPQEDQQDDQDGLAADEHAAIPPVVQREVIVDYPRVG